MLFELTISLVIVQSYIHRVLNFFFDITIIDYADNLLVYLVNRFQNKKKKQFRNT